MKQSNSTCSFNGKDIRLEEKLELIKLRNKKLEIENDISCFQRGR